MEIFRLISRQNMRTANVSIISETYEMISKFHLYFRTDVESYFVIGQLHVNLDPSTNQRLDALQFHFFWFRGHARAPIIPELRWNRGHSLRARAPHAREGQRTGVCTVSPVFL